jgi:hypothetical protein
MVTGDIVRRMQWAFEHIATVPVHAAELIVRIVTRHADGRRKFSKLID